MYVENTVAPSGKRVMMLLLLLSQSLAMQLNPTEARSLAKMSVAGSILRQAAYLKWKANASEYDETHPGQPVPWVPLIRSAPQWEGRPYIWHDRKYCQCCGNRLHSNPFGLWPLQRRHHHCRNCGEIICFECAKLYENEWVSKKCQAMLRSLGMEEDNLSSEDNYPTEDKLVSNENLPQLEDLTLQQLTQESTYIEIILRRNTNRIAYGPWCGAQNGESDIFASKVRKFFKVPLQCRLDELKRRQTEIQVELERRLLPRREALETHEDRERHNNWLEPGPREQALAKMLEEQEQRTLYYIQTHTEATMKCEAEKERLKRLLDVEIQKNQEFEVRLEIQAREVQARLRQLSKPYRKVDNTTEAGGSEEHQQQLEREELQRQVEQKDEAIKKAQEKIDALKIMVARLTCDEKELHEQVEHERAQNREQAANLVEMEKKLQKEKEEKEYVRVDFEVAHERLTARRTSRVSVSREDDVESWREALAAQQRKMNLLRDEKTAMEHELNLSRYEKTAMEHKLQELTGKVIELIREKNLFEVEQASTDDDSN